MKRIFFYDTEFIERPGLLDLISIGICALDDESMFYAVSTEFDPEQANDFVKSQVLPKLPERTSPVWMNRAEMAAGVLDYLRPSSTDKVELWGYYPAFDHVALAWLYGPMVDLPKGMPMLTLCLKQWALRVGNPRFPGKPESAHDALSDALWNREVFRFLVTQPLPYPSAGR